MIVNRYQFDLVEFLQSFGVMFLEDFLGLLQMNIYEKGIKMKILV